MTRDRVQQVVAWTAALAISAAAVVRMADRGGPYVQAPRTVVDHVSRQGHETREALILVPQVARLIPRGATVTAFRPQDGRAQNDHPSYLTAVGLLPHHAVLPPFTAFPDTSPRDLAEYVVAIGAPFDHPRYRVVAGFPNGWLYQVR